jgi:hypothetical protein
VRFLYFQMLEEAAEHDKARLPGETPAAYAPRLAAAVAHEEATAAPIAKLPAEPVPTEIDPPEVVPGATSQIQPGYTRGTQPGAEELDSIGAAMYAGDASTATQAGVIPGDPAQADATQADPAAAIRTLTDAFVQVRYAGQQVEEAQASWLRQVWERLRRRFG